MPREMYTIERTVAGRDFQDREIVRTRPEAVAAPTADGVISVRRPRNQAIDPPPRVS